MKLRIQYPLWNIFGLVPLLIFGWGAISLEAVHQDSSFGIFLQKVILVGLLLVALYFFMYAIVVIRHNKKYPKHKVHPFSLQPNEYVEDDEMFKEVTMRATKKVYSFIYWALPALLGITLVIENRSIIYFGIIIIIIIQNSIYYREMKQYAPSAEE